MARISARLPVQLALDIDRPRAQHAVRDRLYARFDLRYRDMSEVALISHCSSSASTASGSQMGKLVGKAVYCT
jgi:hypothetical protein